MLSHQRFVRRDNIFAGFQQLQHDRLSGLDATDQLSHHFDAVVIDDFLDIVSDDVGWQIDITRFVQVTHDGMSQPQLPSGVSSHAVTVVVKKSSHTGSHGTHPDDGDACFFHFVQR